MPNERAQKGTRERYRILRRLGDSARGEGFLAQDSGTGQRLVIEVLRPELVGDPARVRKLFEQVGQLARISHAALGRYYDAFPNEQGVPCLALERIQGESLDERVHHQGPVDVDTVRRLGKGICEGLAHLHARERLHGDLRAADVMLFGDPSAPVAKLTHWGFGGLLGRSASPYVAPERFAGQRASTASDLWSVGVILYEALTGAVPFTVSALRGGKPLSHPPLEGEAATLAEAIDACLQADPRARLADAGALAAQLDGKATGAAGYRNAATLRLPAEPPQRPPREARSRAAPPTPRSKSKAVPPSAPARPPPGARRIGEYRLLKRLGAGGMGEVWLAQHEGTGESVAIKTLLPELASDSETVTRFVNEARAVNAISHENIVRVFDFVEEKSPEPLVYCVMELLVGKSLGQEMRKAPLSLERIYGITRQVCEALSAAHWAGVIHRDVKPANIFLADVPGYVDFVKVLDFGVAKVAWAKTEQGTVTKTGTAVGTPEYMAPEQAMAKKVDRRTDVYAVGVVLYELLAGKRPFGSGAMGEVLVQIVHDEPPPLPEVTAAGEAMPRALADLVMRCLAKPMADRPQTMEALLGELEKARVSTVSLGAVRAADRKKRRRGWIRKTVLLAMLVGVSAAAIHQYGGPAATWRKARHEGRALALRLLAPSAPPPVKGKIVPLKVSAAEQKLIDARNPKPTVALVVDSIPEGATVIRTDTHEVLGITPLDTRVIKGGTVTLRLEMDGWTPAETTLSLGADVQLKLPLAKVAAKAPVSRPHRSRAPSRKPAAPAKPKVVPVAAVVPPKPVAVVTHPAVLRPSTSPAGARPEPNEIRVAADGTDFAVYVRFNRPGWGAACAPKCAETTLYVDTDGNVATGRSGSGAMAGADLSIRLKAASAGESPDAPWYVTVQLVKLEGGGTSPLKSLDSRESGRIRLKPDAARLRLDGTTLGVPLGPTLRAIYQPAGSAALVASGTGLTAGQTEGEIEVLGQKRHHKKKKKRP